MRSFYVHRASREQRAMLLKTILERPIDLLGQGIRHQSDHGIRDPKRQNYQGYQEGPIKAEAMD
jgi:hypothetical protein